MVAQFGFWLTKYHVGNFAYGEVAVGVKKIKYREKIKREKEKGENFI